LRDGLLLSSAIGWSPIECRKDEAVAAATFASRAFVVVQTLSTAESDGSKYFPGEGVRGADSGCVLVCIDLIYLEHWQLPDGTGAPADLMTGMSESQLKLIAEREALKHTLGNLTLLTDARNPSLGNLDFTTKQLKLRKSLLKLNHEIADMPDWTEERIRARAVRLSDLAIKVWPALDNAS
jgi:hypothetical protein